MRVKMSSRDLLLTLLVVATWGLHLPIIKFGIQDIPPLFLISLRFTLTALIFLPFKGRMPAGLWRPFLTWVGVHYIGQMTIMFLALNYIEAATMSLLFQAQVPFAILLGWLIHKEKIGRTTVVGLLIAFMGVALIYGSPDIVGWLGPCLSLFSAFCWGLGSNLMRRIQDIDYGTMTFYSCLISLPFTASASLLTESPSLAMIYDAEIFGLIFVLAYQVLVMSSMMYLWKELINRNRVEKVSAFVLLQPIFGVIGGVLLLNETIAVQAISGGILALAGVAIIVLRRAQNPRTME